MAVAPVTRMVRMRGVPRLGDLTGNTSRRIRYYLCRERLLGMKPFDEVGLRLFAYERNKADPSDPLVVTATNGTRTDTITVGLGCGGCIESWQAADSSAGYDVQFLSTAGTSRGIAACVERIEANGDEYHPYMAGSKFDGAGQEGTLADNYAVTDVIQGSPVTSQSVADLGGGRKIIRTGALGMEWDPNGEIFGTDHHGDCLNAIIYPDIRFLQDIYVNVGGVAGLHRIEQTVIVPGNSATGDVTRIISPQIHLPYMFDQLQSFIGSANTSIGNVEMESAISDSIASYAYPDANTIDVTLSGSHGRNVGTQQWLTISGASGSPDINAAVFSEWQSATTFRFTASGHGTYSGGSVTSPTIRYAQWTDTEVRDGFADDIVFLQPANVTTKAPDNDVGTYLGRGVFDAAEIAGLVFRTVTSEPNQPWSPDIDFSVGIVAPKGGVTARDISGGVIGRKCFRWYNDDAGETTPTGDASDPPYSFLGRCREWDATMTFRGGPYKTTTWLVTGPFDSVVRPLIAGLA